MPSAVLSLMEKLQTSLHGMLSYTVGRWRQVAMAAGSYGRCVRSLTGARNAPRKLLSRPPNNSTDTQKLKHDQRMLFSFCVGLCITLIVCTTKHRVKTCNGTSLCTPENCSQHLLCATCLKTGYASVPTTKKGTGPSRTFIRNM